MDLGSLAPEPLLDAPFQKSVAIISNAVYLQISKTQLSCYALEKKIRTLLSFAENLLHHLYSQGGRKDSEDNDSKILSPFYNLNAERLISYAF